MYGVLLSLYLIVAILLIAMILLQHGKGASMGASFGAGASNTVFGSVGNGNFLTHSTAVLAFLFFVISLALSAYSSHADNQSTDFENLQQDQITESIATPVKDIDDLPADSKEINNKVIDSKSDIPADKTDVVTNQTELKAKVEDTKSKVETEVNQKVDEVNQKIEETKSNVEDKVNQKVDEVNQKIEETKSNVETEVKEKVDNVVEKSKEEVSNIQETVEKKVDSVVEDLKK